MAKQSTPARWYMLNKDGMATLCADKADAEQEAIDAQAAWPGMGPHRAVQLVEAGASLPLPGAHVQNPAENEHVAGDLSKNWAEANTMGLIDAYAEARHVGGRHTYNAKTAEARVKVVAALRTQQPAPATQQVEATKEHVRLVRVIADKIEDGTLFRSGIYSNKDLARFIRNVTDAAAPQFPSPQAADSVLEDAARLDWLLLRISGAEFRRLGVHYSDNARRADVDAARKQGGAT